MTNVSTLAGTKKTNSSMTTNAGMKADMKSVMIYADEMNADATKDAS